MYNSLFIHVKYKPKGSVIAKSINYSSHETLNDAYAHLYNYHELCMVKKMSNDSYFMWDGNANKYTTSDYLFAIIMPNKKLETSFGLDFQGDFRIKKWITEMIEHKYNDEPTYINSGKYINKSNMLHDLVWRNSIPKGWKLLRPGQTILETDKEFNDYGSGPKFWSIVSHYNISIKVKPGNHIRFIEHGKKDRIVKRHPEPLIIRKSK